MKCGDFKDKRVKVGRSVKVGQSLIVWREMRLLPVKQICFAMNLFVEAPKSSFSSFENPSISQYIDWMSWHKRTSNALKWITQNNGIVDKSKFSDKKCTIRRTKKNRAVSNGFKRFQIVLRSSEIDQNRSKCIEMYTYTNISRHNGTVNTVVEAINQSFVAVWSVDVYRAVSMGLRFCQT